MAPSNTRVEFEYVGPGGGRSSSLRPQLVAKGLFLCSGLPRTGAGETDKLGKHREHASPVECLPGSSPGADCPSVLPARRGAPFQVPVGRTWFHPHHQWFHPHYQPRERQGACGISTSGWSLAHDGTLSQPLTLDLLALPSPGDGGRGAGRVAPVETPAREPLCTNLQGKSVNRIAIIFTMRKSYLILFLRRWL